MTNQDSVTSFGQLATEIVLEIFDYLTSNEMLYAFFHLNQRFNSIVLEHPQYLTRFETPTRNYCLWQTVLPLIKSQIEHLTITTIDSRFSLDLFPNLKSVTISSVFPIDSEDLTTILRSEQFCTLTALHIRNPILSRTRYDGTTALYEAVLQRDNALHTVELLPRLCLSSSQNNKNVNIQALTVKVAGIRDLLILLRHTPNLQYLNLSLSSMYFFDESKQAVDLVNIKLTNLLLEVEETSISPSNFLFLTNLIKRFSTTLHRLSLNLNYVDNSDDYFDGSTLQRQLLASMTQLNSFHFHAVLDPVPGNVENLLSSFQNQFWFSHRWFVGLHGKYLYTLPFHFTQLKDFIGFDEIQSSDTKILTSPSTWARLISIDLSQCSSLNLNLIKQLKMRMPSLKSLTVNSDRMSKLYRNETEENYAETALHSVSIVRCEGEHLRYIEQWLTRLAPNAGHLVLTCKPQPGVLSSSRTVFLQKLDDYYRDKQTTTNKAHSSNMQHVEIRLILKDDDDLHRHVLRLVRELLEVFTNVRSFSIELDQASHFPSLMWNTDLDTMVQLLKVDKISKKYHMGTIQNYLQFVQISDD